MIDLIRRNDGPPVLLKTRNLAEVKPQRITWTWNKRIPKGKLTMIAGQPTREKVYSR